MITGMRVCVMHDFWPWPISSRSFTHNFVIKTVKVWYILFLLCSTYSFDSAMESFHIWQKRSLACIWEGRVQDFWPWPIFLGHCWSMTHLAMSLCNICNRLVSQMRAPLAACRKPAGKLWQLCKVLYGFEHKMQYLFIHAPSTRIVVFRQISNMPP